MRALEAWVGAPLFERDTHRVLMSPAGERFRPIAEETLRRLYVGREEALETAQASFETLKFAATHALSLTFFPQFLRSIEATSTLAVPVRLVADTMVACERIMLQGEAQFLLCHHHDAAPSCLGAEQFLSATLGHDVLIPVSVPDEPGLRKPRYSLPGSTDSPLSYLAYTGASGMGRIVAAARVNGPPAWLVPAFMSHLAVILVTMAKDGRGVGWLPKSLVDRDLSSGQLVRAGGEEWDITMEVRMFRPRTRQSAAAERFWTEVVHHERRLSGRMARAEA